MIMMNQNIEEGAIQLDNQGIQVRILAPGGRFQVTDKVSGAVWSMRAGNSSGAVSLQEADQEIEYKFGSKQGVLFTENYYMTRSTDTEDFHDVSLTGSLCDDQETKITIRYLLSTTFPVLNCYCYASGKRCDQVQKIQFPLGFRLADGEGNNIWLPRDVKQLQSDGSDQSVALFQPPPEENHRAAGAPFFILTRRDSERQACGCIGYLQHPLSLLDVIREKNNRYATPLSTKLDVTGKIERNPYYFRYQFVPSDDPDALSWLYREYLLQQESSFQL
ncbi:MAG: hypothetical protein JXR73_23555 [Candidatus Omnitrophica bacterium]|nr:hypothetical protein [Candidatus Omnitrophota bacterium]